MEPRIKSIFDQEEFNKTPDQVLKLLLLGQIKKVKELEEENEKQKRAFASASHILENYADCISVKDILTRNKLFDRCHMCTAWINPKEKRGCHQCQKICNDCHKFSDIKPINKYIYKN